MFFRIFILAALLAAGAGGCASFQPPDARSPAHFQSTYRQFDLELAWDVRIGEAETTIEGVVKNVRYTHMDDLEIWVTLPNAQGTTGIRSVAFVIPPMLVLGQSEPFSLKVPKGVKAGDKLEFTYKYRAFEGGDKTGLPWMQSFTAEVPAK